MTGPLSTPRHHALLSPDYHAPRELEHPLQPLAETTTDTFVWIQPQWMRPAYELWAEERVVATLRYRGLAHPTALATAHDGLWTFSQPHDFSTVEIGRGAEAVGRLWCEQAMHGSLSLRGGAIYHWVRPDLRAERWHFLREDERALLHFEPERGLTARMRIDLAPGARLCPDLSLLMLLGQYVLLARRA